MANKIKVKRRAWDALARTLESNGTPSTKDKELAIEEVTRSVWMDDGIEPYGRPISAPLAIKLMAECWKMLMQAIGKNDNPLDYKEISLAEKVELLQRTIEQMMVASFGITFDKNILLKILSQPGCVGMRSYFCVKSVPSKQTPKDEDYLSLVLVGVDDDGYDLHYGYATPGDVTREGPEPETRSLTAEYGHPPTGRKGLNILDDPRYVLLEHAKNSLP